MAYGNFKVEEYVHKGLAKPHKALMSLIGIPWPRDVVCTEAELAQSADVERDCTLYRRL